MKVLFICYNKDIIKGIDDVSFAPVGGQASVDTTSGASDAGSHSDSTGEADATSAASSHWSKEKVEKSCLILFSVQKIIP